MERMTLSFRSRRLMLIRVSPEACSRCSLRSRGHGLPAKARGRRRSPICSGRFRLKSISPNSSRCLVPAMFAHRPWTDVKRDGLNGNRCMRLCAVGIFPEHGKIVVRTRGADETFDRRSESPRRPRADAAREVYFISVLRAAPRNASFSTGLRVLVGVMNTICPSPLPCWPIRFLRALRIARLHWLARGTVLRSDPYLCCKLPFCRHAAFYFRIIAGTRPARLLHSNKSRQNIQYQA